MGGKTGVCTNTSFGQCILNAISFLLLSSFLVEAVHISHVARDIKVTAGKLGVKQAIVTISCETS